MAQAAGVCRGGVEAGDGGMKRVFDICLGCLAALILCLPFLVVAMAVRLPSKGPALYWTDRVGRNNLIFKMPKFRSMRLVRLKWLRICWLMFRRI